MLSEPARDACSLTRPSDAVRQAGSRAGGSGADRLGTGSLELLQSPASIAPRNLHQRKLLYGPFNVAQATGVRQDPDGRQLAPEPWHKRYNVVSGSAWPRHRGTLKHLPRVWRLNSPPERTPGLSFPLRTRPAGPRDGIFPAAPGAARKRHLGSTVSVPAPSDHVRWQPCMRVARPRSVPFHDFPL